MIKEKPYSAQTLQDNLFRKMTADQKVLLGAGLWKLARDLARNKITYGSQRSKRTPGSHSKNS